MSDKPSYDDRNGKRDMPATAPKPDMVLTLTYDPETHGVKVDGAEHFKNWAMVAAVLGMGQDVAKFNNNLSMAQNVQKRQVEEAMRQQEAAKLAQRLGSLKH